MLEIIFILLLVFAILLIIFSLEYEGNPFWNLVSIAFSAMLWFVLALSNMEIERPYVLYNASAGVIQEGIHTVSSPVSPFIVYIFAGMGVIMTLYLIARVFGQYIELE